MKFDISAIHEIEFERKKEGKMGKTRDTSVTSCSDYYCRRQNHALTLIPAKSKTKSNLNIHGLPVPIIIDARAHLSERGEGATTLGEKLRLTVNFGRRRTVVLIPSVSPPKFRQPPNWPSAWTEVRCHPRIPTFWRTIVSQVLLTLGRPDLHFMIPSQRWLIMFTLRRPSSLY